MTTFSFVAAAAGATATRAMTDTRRSRRRTWNRLRDEAGQAAGRRTEGPRVLEHGRKQVAELLDPAEHDVHRVVARAHVLRQLVPVQRRRHRRAGLRPHRVDGGDRLAPTVLAVV